MSFFRLMVAIAVLVGGAASASMIWVGMEMLGLPGWTAIVLVVFVAAWLGRALDRLTRPANRRPGYISNDEILQRHKRPAQPRRTSLH
jgi:TRAP-type C4-dicarboxylate transport system permease small subunit